MIDLLKIAKTESDGDLLGELSNIFEVADIKPEGYPDAIVWQGGNHDGVIAFGGGSGLDVGKAMRMLAKASKSGLSEKTKEAKKARSLLFNQKAR